MATRIIPEPPLERAPGPRASSDGSTLLQGRPDDSERKPSRWWLGVFVGSFVSLPTGWLLSYGAALPFLLGLFFFVLFGLILGAIVFRITGRGFKVGRTPLVLGTTLIVSLAWSMSIYEEARGFPTEISYQASASTRDLAGQSVQEFRSAIANAVRGFLARTYPPGGTIGYVRWVLLRGEVGPEDIPGLPRTIVRDQRGIFWAIRAILSVGLLAFGVGSQTLGLQESKAS